jgi:hypothetical protein
MVQWLEYQLQATYLPNLPLRVYTLRTIVTACCVVPPLFAPLVVIWQIAPTRTKYSRIFLHGNEQQHYAGGSP